MTIKEPHDDRYVTFINNDKSRDWEDFLYAANIDYISFFMQYHLGICTWGTVLWMMQQSIEKYCKTILNKSDPQKYSEEVLKNNKYGHNLMKLWKELKQHTNQFSFEVEYENFVQEINKCTTDTRYLNYTAAFTTGFMEVFTILGCEFRYEILGEKKFIANSFGLPANYLFKPRDFLNNYSYELMFKKLMHLSIDHRISFDHSGHPNTYEDTGIKLIEATTKFCQHGKHKEVENKCPLCSNAILQIERCSETDLEVLKSYLGA